MELRLDSLILHNFKGVKDAEYHFGDLTEIAGRNGSGKTTIPDAFFWLVFNKSSAGSAPGSDDFHEKPLDQDGNEIHDLDTSVEAICRLDGDPFNLKRVQKENWVKKRGAAEAVYQGNVSTYFINGVEVKASEFKSRINMICSEKVFGLIARMSAMNNLPWQDRRAILVEMADIDVNEVLLRKDEYSSLAVECTTRGVTMDDLKKVLQSSLRDVNRELTLIPARIDEATRSLPKFAEYQVGNAKEAVEDLPVKIKDAEDKLLAMSSGDAAALRIGKLSALRTELTAIQNAILADHERGRKELATDCYEADSMIYSLTGQLKTLDSQRKQNADRMASLEGSIKNLREKYSAAYNEKFKAPDVSNVCPVCGQITPASYRDEIIVKARRSFLEERKLRLERINVDGINLKKQLEAASAEDNRLGEQESKLTNELDNAREKKNSAEAALKAYPAVPDYGVNPRYEELKAQITEMNAEPDKPEADEDQRVAIKADIERLKTDLDNARRTLAEAEAGQRIQVRIAELNLQKRSAGDEAARLEQKIDLCGKFIADRCKLLEDTIDGFFPSVKWKLFNTQINGGIVDCCECMIPCGGSLVPYQGANTGSKLHADMEIINALSDHYDVRLPLFFDNRESVNDVPALHGQLITLSVSNDAELKITTK
jgi:chromosome segregation ATPase